MTPTRYLTAVQRTPPQAYDRTHARRLESGGGIEVASPMTLAPGLETEQTRTPGTVFDGGVMRDRGPFYRRPVVVRAGDSWVDWTGAGPTRPELHMRNVTYREEVGSSRSRFPVVNSPTTGMHTMQPAGTQRTASRYVKIPQMVPARVDRLSPARYAGQTFSQTTRLQGGR